MLICIDDDVQRDAIGVHPLRLSQYNSQHSLLITDKFQAPHAAIIEINDKCMSKLRLDILEVIPVFKQCPKQFPLFQPQQPRINSVAIGFD